MEGDGRQGTRGTRELFLAAAAALRPLLRDPAVAGAWDQPSALALWSVGGLAGHAARAVLVVEEYLAGPVGDSVVPLTAVQYYAALALDPDATSPVNSSIRARGDETGRLGPDEVAARFDASVERLTERLRAEPPDRTLTVFNGHVMTLDEYLLTRVLELTVHTDDLCASCRLPTPELPGMAASIRLMVDLASTRHGELAVLRAMARRERDQVNALRVF